MFNSYMDLLRKNWVKLNILSVRRGGNSFKVQFSVGLFGMRFFKMSCASTLQLNLRAVQLQEWRSMAVLSYDLKSCFKSLLIFLVP